MGGGGGLGTGGGEEEEGEGAGGGYSNAADEDKGDEDDGGSGFLGRSRGRISVEGEQRSGVIRRVVFLNWNRRRLRRIQNG